MNQSLIILHLKVYVKEEKITMSVGKRLNRFTLF